MWLILHVISYPHAVALTTEILNFEVPASFWGSVFLLSLAWFNPGIIQNTTIYNQRGGSSENLLLWGNRIAFIKSNIVWYKHNLKGSSKYKVEHMWNWKDYIIILANHLRHDTCIRECSSSHVIACNLFTQTGYSLKKLWTGSQKCYTLNFFYGYWRQVYEQKNRKWNVRNMRYMRSLLIFLIYLLLYSTLLYTPWIVVLLIASKDILKNH